MSAKLRCSNSLSRIVSGISQMTIVEEAAYSCEFSGGTAFGTAPGLDKGQKSADIVAVCIFRLVRQRVQKFVYIILVCLDSFGGIPICLQPLNILCSYPIFSTLSI